VWCAHVVGSLVGFVGGGGGGGLEYVVVLLVAVVAIASP
jgi:hypothetical protein